MPENQAVVSPEEWRAARLQLLEKEKEFTRLRDELSRQRRALPRVRITKDYVFEGAQGPETLPQLFGGRSQLVVYHFMFAPEWDEGCKSCSWWADNFERNAIHLAHRDVTLAAISRAPFAKLDAFGRRMGWTFKWLSSGANDFSYDFGASFTAEALAAGEVDYNYRRERTAMTDRTGISVLYRDPDGAVFHTYSCYARGVEMMNAGYHYLDLVPKGRNEARLPYSQAWVRHHDAYDR
jgi:predicted dithiol-disulfide oxidoreductase (DUF899 family)